MFQLAGETLNVVVKRIQSLGRVGLKCSSKVALLSDDATVHATVVADLNTISEVMYTQ